jgi:hypothetical protein
MVERRAEFATMQTRIGFDVESRARIAVLAKKRGIAMVRM